MLVRPKSSNILSLNNGDFIFERNKLYDCLFLNTLNKFQVFDVTCHGYLYFKPDEFDKLFEIVFT